MTGQYANRLGSQIQQIYLLTSHQWFHLPFFQRQKYTLKQLHNIPCYTIYRVIIVHQLTIRSINLTFEIFSFQGTIEYGTLHCHI